jgi:hypothetical protein
MTSPRATLFAILVALAGSILTIPCKAQVYVSGNARVLGVLEEIRTSLRTTRYDHQTHIDPLAGRYDFDCSTMAAWVLGRATPRARAALPSGRPLAVDFWRTIRDAPTVRPRNGWLQVRRIADARPGDVLAWPRPRWFRSNNSGHVGFVAEAPTVTARGVLVRITDATSVGHQDDPRNREGGPTGFGQGTLLIATDPLTGEGTAYGWVGIDTPPEWMIATPVRIGRVVR